MNSKNTTQHKPNTNALGIVARLWRYPVKSMRGESCNSLRVNSRGIVGDRLFALRNSQGKFGSGKNTRRFRRIDGLIGFQSSYDGDVPIVHFPDGRTMRGDDTDIDSVISNMLGQSVALVREADISHLDAGPVHILTTAALAWLQSVLPTMVADERRFRPNLLLDVPGNAQVEREWRGKILDIGEVRLRVSIATERCRMVSFAQEELPYDTDILKCISQEAAMQFGVYADVLIPGRIVRGDRVTIVN